MESTSPRPDPVGPDPAGLDPAQARAALAGIQQVQRAVRDTPWPTWLYPVNAALLGALTLTFALQAHRTAAFLAVALAVVGVNALAGYRMGTPWALPTSRLFLGAVAAAGGCVLAAAVASDLAEGTARSRLVLLLALAASALYLAGAVAHRRCTGRPARGVSRRAR